MTQRQTGRLVAILALLTAGLLGIDRGADGHFGEQRSLHFVVLEDVAIDGHVKRRRFEREVTQVLEHAYRSVGDVLGLRPRGKVRVVLYDSKAFDRLYGNLFAFRAAGFYERAIHVRAGVRVDLDLARTLHHEYTHAALAAAAGGYRPPGWVNEGLAEWFEARSVGQRALGRAQRRRLWVASRQGGVPALAALSGPSFVGLSAGQAELAYLWSYAAIDHLAHSRRPDRLRRFVELLLRSRDPGAALRRVYRLDLDALDRELRLELGAHPAAAAAVRKSSL